MKEAQHCAHLDQGLQIVCNNFRTNIEMSFLHRTLELDGDAYQTGFVYPFSLLLLKTCLEKNVIQIVIVILLCRNEDIPNLIILLSLDLFSS